jgi:hypothetical protein
MLRMSCGVRSDASNNGVGSGLPIGGSLDTCADLEEVLRLSGRSSFLVRKTASALHG